MDSSKLIIEIIRSVLRISGHSAEHILGLVEVEEHRNGEIFIEKGKRDHHEYFMLDGVCRSFLLNPEGEEVTIDFFTQGSIISPYVTRTINGISSLNFEALTHLVVGKMDSSGFEDLMVENLEIREFGNMVLKMELQRKVEKETDMASLTARDRLLKFRTKYPQLENMVPHGAIASFLGITTVSLSRLRKELSS